jgi:hypothetical protein
MTLKQTLALAAKQASRPEGTVSTYVGPKVDWTDHADHLERHYLSGIQKWTERDVLRREMREAGLL